METTAHQTIVCQWPPHGRRRKQGSCCSLIILKLCGKRLSFLQKLSRGSSLGEKRDLEVRSIYAGVTLRFLITFMPWCCQFVIKGLSSWAVTCIDSRKHPWKPSLGQTCFLSPCSRSCQDLLRHDSLSVRGFSGSWWWTRSQQCRMTSRIRNRMQNTKYWVMRRKASRNYSPAVGRKGSVNKRD